MTTERSTTVGVENQPHKCGPCECRICGHAYVGVWPIEMEAGCDEDNMECPSCGHMTSGPVGADDEDDDDDVFEDDDTDDADLEFEDDEEDDASYDVGEGDDDDDDDDDDASEEFDEGFSSDDED